MIAAPGFNRWLMPPAALAIHLSIGMAYGFSVFWLPLTQALPGRPACAAHALLAELVTHSCNWRINAVSFTFVLFTLVLGVSAAVWGDWVERVGSRRAGTVAALCWCGGLALGALAVHLHLLWLLWLGTGVIGGIGLGLGYISPLSILLRWFPDRRGLASAMAVMGFGGGAMIGAPLAVMLMHHFRSAGESGVTATFLTLAVLYAIFMLGGALGYRLPARGWKPEGWEPPQPDSTVVVRSVHVSRAWKTRAFWCLWGILCSIVSGGLGVLSLASPMLQEIFGARLIGIEAAVDTLTDDQRTQVSLVAVGFTGLLSLLNISGRFLWALLSDRVGRRATVRLFFILTIPLYLALPWLGSHGHLAAFVLTFCVALSIFGGVFAIMPAYVADLFGSEMVGAIQGRVLTAWSVAGLIGPSLVSGLRDRAIQSGTVPAHAYDLAFYALAGLLCLGLACLLLVRPVDRRHFMSLQEMSQLSDSTSGEWLPAQGRGPQLAGWGGPVAAACIWLAVACPLAWGMWMTLEKAFQLLI